MIRMVQDTAGGRWVNEERVGGGGRGGGDQPILVTVTLQELLSRRGKVSMVTAGPAGIPAARKLKVRGVDH